MDILYKSNEITNQIIYQVICVDHVILTLQKIILAKI